MPSGCFLKIGTIRGNEILCHDYEELTLRRNLQPLSYPTENLVLFLFQNSTELGFEVLMAMKINSVLF
jgi:hypothetical protein